MTILVIDIGSSSVRTLLFTKHLQLIDDAIVKRTHYYTTIPHGAATFNVADLQYRVEACIDDILQHPAASSIQAVGMDIFASNLLGVDESGDVVTPLYTYADTQSLSIAEELSDIVDANAAHQRTGTLTHPAYYPAQLRWLQQQSTRTAHWMDMSTYLYSQWFGGVPRCSYSIASWTGLLNRALLTWDETWLNTIDVSVDTLPTLSDYKNPQQGLQTTYAERWKQLKDIPFFLAVGDGAAANIGSGSVDSTTSALTVGTSSALRTILTVDLPPVPHGLWSYRVDATRHLVGGATTEGGNIFAWAKRTLKLPKDDNELEDLLQMREPDSHGLTFLPLLAGERSPGWAAHATGSLVGLKLSTNAIDILQAALESLAIRLSMITKQLAEVIDPCTHIVASGGAVAESTVLAQMIATALETELQITSQPEITARGTALLALNALDLCQLNEYPPAIQKTISPQTQYIRQFHAARERQQALYDQLIKKETQT